MATLMLILPAGKMLITISNIWRKMAVGVMTYIHILIIKSVKLV